jgi:hypothetical protein
MNPNTNAKVTMEDMNKLKIIKQFIQNGLQRFEDI